MKKEKKTVVIKMFEEMGVRELASCGNITEEITGISFGDFFANLPSVVMELSKHGEKYSSFINSLDNVSGVLCHIAEEQSLLQTIGYFLGEVDETNHKNER